MCVTCTIQGLLWRETRFLYSVCIFCDIMWSIMHWNVTGKMMKCFENVMIWCHDVVWWWYENFDMFIEHWKMFLWCLLILSCFAAIVLTDGRNVTVNRQCILSKNEISIKYLLSHFLYRTSFWQFFAPKGLMASCIYVPNELETTCAIFMESDVYGRSLCDPMLIKF